MARRTSKSKAAAVPAVREDGWVNLMSQLGTSRDTRTHTRIGDRRFSPQELEALYRGDDMAARICEDVPAEMLRAGWTLSLPEGEETATYVRDRCDDLGADAASEEASTWARCFGGGAVLMGVDDGRDPAEPLDYDSIRDVRWLSVFSAPELLPHTWYGDPLAGKFGHPETFRIQPRFAVAGGASRIGVVHESRILKFDGARVTAQQRQRNNGWGDPVFVRIFDVLRDFGMAWGGTGALLNDFSQAVYKMKGLAALLAAGKEQDIKTRMELIEMSRSVIRAVLLDADGEDFERKTTNLSGLPEILEKFNVRLAAAADMPVSRLLGQSPGGLASSDEGQIRWWYDRIAAKQNKELRPQLNTLVKILLRSKNAPTKGIEPESWRIEFNPLWQLSEAQLADVRQKNAAADATYIQNGVLDVHEVRAMLPTRPGYESFEPAPEPVIEIAPDPGEDDDALLTA